MDGLLTGIQRALGVLARCLKLPSKLKVISESEQGVRLVRMARAELLQGPRIAHLDSVLELSLRLAVRRRVRERKPLLCWRATTDRGAA